MKEFYLEPERIRKLRLLTGGQKLEIGVKCMMMGRQIIADSIQAEHPDWIEAEVMAELRRRWPSLTNTDSDALDEEIERRGLKNLWIDEAIQAASHQPSC